MRNTSKFRKQSRKYVMHTDIDEDLRGGNTWIKELAKVVQGNKKLRSPILIAGFPGAGLVGSISTSYIISKLKMSQIACIESEFIVPGVIYAQGKLRHPFRLYASKDGDVCVLVCEAPIMINGMYSVLDTVMKWTLKNDIKEVVVVDGIPIEGLPDPKREPIILSSDGKKADEANLIDGLMNIMDMNSNDNEGSVYLATAFIGGMSGGILSSCLSNGMPSKALLISSTRGIPDPEGAALIIESLSKITNNNKLRIDTEQLRKQGAELKLRMEKIMRSYAEQQPGLGYQSNQEKIGKSNEGIMYG